MVDDWTTNVKQSDLAAASRDLLAACEAALPLLQASPNSRSVTVAAQVADAIARAQGAALPADR